MDSTQEKDTTGNTPSVCTQGLPPIEPVAETTPSAGVCTAGLEGATSVVAQPFYKKHLTLIASAVAVLIVLGAGYFAYTMYYAHGGTVAIVNGTRIYAEEYNASVEYMMQGATAQGVDTTAEQIQSEIRTQALDVLVNNILIISAAKEAGISITDADVQAKYDALVTELGSKEELEKRMTEMKLTDEKLRSNIKDRMLADAYISTKTTVKDLAVTEEEVNEFIKSISTGETKLPPLEEIRPQIEAQILNQKQQQVVTDLITQLRAEGDIDVRI